MKNYYQPEIETMPLEQLQELQSERLVKQVRFVYDNVKFYHDKMDKAGVKPSDIKGIDDLHKLPFITKDDLRDQYPYGLLGVPLEECVRIQSTSGTTGRRVVAFYTQEDIDVWEECCARAIVAAGGSKEDVCHVCYGYGLFTGGPGLNGGSHKVGCLTLPMSSGNTERQLQFMMDLGSTILCCTPSYAANLGEAVNERGLKDQIHLKAGIFGAEPWTEQMRKNIEQSLGIKAYDIYGLTEISGPCMCRKTISLRKLSIQAQVKCFRKVKSGSWYLLVSLRKRFRFCVIVHAICAVLPGSAAPVAVRMYA